MEFLGRTLDWLLKNDVSASEAIMNVIFVLACMAVIISMYRLHRSNGHGNPAYRNFNVVSLIINKDGYLDGAKCMEMGAWLIMTWAFVSLVTAGKLTDAFVAAYVGAFAMRGAYGAFLRNKGTPEQPEGTTTTTTTKTDTVETSKTPAQPNTLKADDVKVEAAGNVTIARKKK